MSCIGIDCPTNVNRVRKCIYDKEGNDSEKAMIQLDGNVSVVSSVDGKDDSISDDNDESSDSEYETEDEAFSDPIPANLFPVSEDITPGQPIKLDLNMKDNLSSNLPLCLLLNARSVYNKCKNLDEMLQQMGPDFCLISETFERETRREKIEI